jgi:hypothetical protein
MTGHSFFILNMKHEPETTPSRLPGKLTSGIETNASI